VILKSYGIVTGSLSACETACF